MTFSVDNRSAGKKKVEEQIEQIEQITPSDAFVKKLIDLDVKELFVKGASTVEFEGNMPKIKFVTKFQAVKPSNTEKPNETFEYKIFQYALTGWITGKERLIYIDTGMITAENDLKAFEEKYKTELQEKLKGINIKRPTAGIKKTYLDRIKKTIPWRSSINIFNSAQIAQPPAYINNHNKF